MLNVFLEKYLPSIIGAVLIGVLLLNPKKWDGVQRVSLGIAGVAVLVFASRTLSIKNQAPAQASSAAQTIAPTTGNATTGGDDSPAVTGSGNSFDYDSDTRAKPNAMPKRESKP